MSSPADSLPSVNDPNETPLDLEESKKTQTKKTSGKSPIDVFLDFLSSVKVGVTLLAFLILSTAIGTFIIQKGTSGFREYYQQLLPAEKTLYTFLGFLDIYHTWWFNLLLLTVSLNIILASIDYFPAAWRYVKKPVLKINQAFINRQPWKDSVVVPTTSVDLNKIKDACEYVFLPGWAKGPLRWVTSVRLFVTENPQHKSTTILVERGVWNRLMPYAIHVALLTIFIGAFIGGQLGRKGVIRLAPGDTTNRFITQSPDPAIPDDEFEMPFTLVCTDIQQDLLNPKKNDLSAPNTLDWHTKVLFQYKGQNYAGHIHLNTPIDFRGYRFFQASFDNVASAREVSLILTPTTGGTPQEVKISREATKVPGVGTLRLADFYPDFMFSNGQVGTRSGEYNNPVAELEWIPESGGAPSLVLAFNAEMAKQVENLPVGNRTLAGTVRTSLKDFEKVSRAHVLQVQYDPGVDTVYLGSALLTLFLWMVFFFSHQRLWILIESRPDGTSVISITGNTNRNRPFFERTFTRLANYLTGKSTTLHPQPEAE